jgi:hypothetical protein
MSGPSGPYQIILSNKTNPNLMSITCSGNDENKIIMDKFMKEASPSFETEFDSQIWTIYKLNSLALEKWHKEKRILKNYLPFPAELISLILEYLGLLCYLFWNREHGIIEPTWSKEACKCKTSEMLIACEHTDWFY